MSASQRLHAVQLEKKLHELGAHLLRPLVLALPDKFGGELLLVDDLEFMLGQAAVLGIDRSDLHYTHTLLQWFLPAGR